MNVYTVMAHGCDTGTVMQVPQGCIFVTLATCGNITITNDSASTNFKNDFSANEPRLRDPIGNIRWLKDRYGSGVNVHCNQEGFDNTYSSIEYEYPFGWCIGTECDPDYVQSIHKDVEMPMDGKLECVCGSMPTGLYKLGATISRGFTVIKTIQNIKEIFNGAILPTKIDSSIKAVLGTNALQPTDYDTLKEISMSAMNSTYIQSQFFIEYPGIYYHITCRSACGNPASLTLRRQHSQIQNEKSNSTLGILTPSKVANAIKMDPTYETLLTMVRNANLSERDKSYIQSFLISDLVDRHIEEDTPTIIALADLLITGGKSKSKSKSIKRKTKKSTRTRINSFVRKRRFK